MSTRRSGSIAAAAVCFGAVLACSAEQQVSTTPACDDLAAWDLPAEVRLQSPDLDSAWLEHQASMTLARLNVVARAAERFCQVNGRYPTDLRELDNAAEEGVLPASCRILPELARDVWDVPFRFSSATSGFTILSAGPDGEFGSEDDLRAATPDDQGATPIDGGDCR